MQTESYTTAVLLSGVRDFPAQMGAGGGADFTGEARFGVQWLLRMWNDRSRTLYYQVGIGSGNDRSATTTSGGCRRPTTATAAAIPLQIHPPPAGVPGGAGGLTDQPQPGRPRRRRLRPCFVVFRTARPALADRCLTSAEHIFDQADTTPGRLLTVIPYDFYPETSWRDDLESGATELSIALAAGGLPSGLPHTNPSFYLGKAAHWAHAYMNSADDSGDTLNLYDTSGLAHYDLYRAIGGPETRPGWPHPGRASGRHAGAAEQRQAAGRLRSIPVRLPVGRLRHRLARVRAVGDGQRVRPAVGHVQLRQPEQPLAGQRAGR